MEKKLFTIAMILLLSLSILAVLRVGLARTEVDLTLPDAELDVFGHGWGPGALVGPTDISGLGVEFSLSSLSPTSGSGYNNNFPVNQLAGGSLDDRGHYGDFSRYTNYRLAFKNQGINDVQVQLFMNTGYTGIGEPNNWNSGSYVTVPAGQTVVVTMDLSSVPLLNHVSNIGFQVLGSGDGTASLVVYATTNLYMNPLTVEKHISADPIGSTFEMTAKTENVADLYGLDIKITWDSALLDYDHESYVSLLNDMWGSGEGVAWSVWTHEGGSGYYRFIAVSLGNSFTGSHELFTVGFKIRDPNTNSMKQTLIHFDIHKLSDKDSHSMTHDAEDGTYQVWGKTPTLSITNSIGGNSRTCRELSEHFNVIVGISDAASVTGFTFKVNYDKNMITYVSGTAVWGGSVSDDGNGEVTVSATGSGSLSTLATITFESNPAFTRIWRDPSTGQSSNVFSSSTGIELYSATLSYPEPYPLSYTRGESSPHQINPPTSDISYTFLPIKGDLNNDGSVLIGDLLAVASHYDQNNADYNLVGGSPYLVDIFDLVVIASNFWYTYP